jgi:hypothetical protein
VPSGRWTVWTLRPDGVHRGRTAWTLPGRDGPVHVRSHCHVDTASDTCALRGGHPAASPDTRWTRCSDSRGHGGPPPSAWHHRVEATGSSRPTGGRWWRAATARTSAAPGRQAGPAAAHASVIAGRSSARASSNVMPSNSSPWTSPSRQQAVTARATASGWTPSAAQVSEALAFLRARARRPGDPAARRWRRDSGVARPGAGRGSARPGRSWCLCAAGRTRGRPR